MSGTDLTGSSARRKYLYTAVTALCYECGFTSADKAALETLTEMLQSILCELARSCRAYCELSGRTEVLGADVLMAMVEMGLDVESVFNYAKRPSRISLPTPVSIPRSSISRILQAGEKRSLPSYIPEHYPPFPDPHAYIRTPTHKQPVTEYEAIREKAASQKRDVERALTRFIAKTGCTQSLYPDDVTLFPLIACKPSANPYFSALLFKDQVFDEKESEATIGKSKAYTPGLEDSDSQKDVNMDVDIMDNPYLRQPKFPRKRRK